MICLEREPFILDTRILSKLNNDVAFEGGSGYWFVTTPESGLKSGKSQPQLVHDKYLSDKLFRLFDEQYGQNTLNLEAFF